MLMENGILLYSGDPSSVFADSDLISRARMKLPLVMEIYRELVERGIVNGSKPPRNVLDLIDISETASQAKISKRDLGRIYICNAETIDTEMIKALGEKVDYIGAMGTSAKILAAREKINLDFTYGVIDKCILKALAGKSSLILTSEGMVNHTLTRIRDYGIEAGLDLNAEQIVSE